MKKKKIKIIIGIIFAMALGAAAFSFFEFEKARNSNLVKVSGNIEGNEVRISFRVQGQIEKLLADEGILLKVGDIVARLDTDELEKIKAEQEASLKAAEVQYKLDYDDYVRSENLLKAGAISIQERDTARTKAEATKANIEQLRASLELANTRLGFARLASPLNGYITSKTAETGEVVQVGAPVFTAIDLNDIWVTAYLKETDLAKVKYGQKAYVQTDTYPGKKYDGWVSFVSEQTEFTPKYIQTNEERVKYVYRIKVRVDNASLELKPGMPADAYIILAEK